MGEKTLVIVESPTKARTITKFLGKDYIVKASNGHIRDLPTSAAEIPAKLKKEAWARLGVNVQQNFEALYVIPKEKKDHVKSLQDALKNADVLYLATDEDREGESISWHLVETLKPKIPTRRLVFHEITKEAIERAVHATRDIDEDLVKAQETRRIVDRLFGYEVSPLLWKKMLPRLSAGRVQSVAVRLLVDRERARIRFKPAQFWGIKGSFGKLPEGDLFDAELTHLGENRVATGKEFDPNTGELVDGKGIVVLTGESARALRERLLAGKGVVSAVDEKPFTSRPAPPFVTSTLQQEANRKLRMSAKRTMTVAQQLYENGFITYMRTDSTTLSEQALSAARSYIQSEYGPEYLPAKPRLYATKVRNAQEAHEAIRPAGERFSAPDVVEAKLGAEARKLYELIWKRTVGSQMADAKGTYVTVSIQCDEARFRAVGKTIEFPGFLRAYVEGSDDPEADIADQERILPKMAVGEALRIGDLECQEHNTQPPPRFTEGSLIKELEQLGIGRPSTWATIVELVLNRSYAFKKGNALCPTFVAVAVVGLLEKNFSLLLDYEFTARLEDDLDSISRGEAGSLEYLKQFYFGNEHPGLKALVSQGEKSIDPREVCGVPIGENEAHAHVEVRIGRYGPYVTDGTRRASVPENFPPDEMTLVTAEEMLTRSGHGADAIGTHPESNLPIFLKDGPYGHYIQLGEGGAENERPKMVSLLPGMKPEEMNLELALKLLSLPRQLGEHPELHQPVAVMVGRFGPYVKCGDQSRSIPTGEFSPLEMTLEQAVELMKRPKNIRGRNAAATVLKELGAHPNGGAALVVKSGRYGPYVTDGKINASLPRGKNLDSLTVEEAVGLLDARAERIKEEEASGAPKKRGKRGGGKKKGKAKAAENE